MSVSFSSRGGSQIRTVSITSGKGGVGKSSILANLATQLGKEGKRVLILDGDLGMANVDIMFGARAHANIHDVLTGSCELKEILIEVARNVTLIPGGSGLFELQNLSVFERQLLLDQVSALGTEYDIMLVDTAPGIDDNVLYLNSAAQEICVVVTPEPASLTDSYALIKVLNQRYKENRFSIICNEVRDEAEGLQIFQRLSDVANQFLYVSLDFKGSVPADPILRQSTKAQRMVTIVQPDAPSSHAIRKMAQKFKGYERVEECKGNMQFFWEQLVGVA